jgi:Protein of unknown function (DUF2778)
MPWTYQQSTGKLTRDGKEIATGYSGKGLTSATGRNNPDMENVAASGPIPRGQYSIGALRNSENTGPNVMDLTPVGHSAHGRSAFQIHGNNRANDASHGCIILPPAIRQQVASSSDKVLHVIK